MTLVCHGRTDTLLTPRLSLASSDGLGGQQLLSSGDLAHSRSPRWLHGMEGITRLLSRILASGMLVSWYLRE